MLIEIEDLHFSYPAGDGFSFPSFGIDAGEALLITGPSGVGKTTLLHLLSGFLKPDGGSVVIKGQDIYALNERKRDAFRGKNIGLIFQSHHFVKAVNARENVLMSAYAAGLNANGERADLLLQKLGLEDKKQQSCSSLSVGEQQRLSIARALLNKPALVLADEPTSSLDDDNARQVAQLLQNITKESQSALIIVTHDERLKNLFPRHIALEQAHKTTKR